MHCGLRGEFPGWTASFGQKAPAGGLALWGSFGEGREIALIGPAVTVALKAQAFSPGFYLIVPGSLSRTRVPLRWLRAFSRRAGGRELSVSLKHTQAAFAFASLHHRFSSAHETTPVQTRGRGKAEVQHKTFSGCHVKKREGAITADGKT